MMIHDNGSERLLLSLTHFVIQVHYKPLENLLYFVIKAFANDLRDSWNCKGYVKHTIVDKGYQLLPVM